MFNEVGLEAWLTIDSCYLIGWNQQIPAGITASVAAAAGAGGNLPAVHFLSQSDIA